MSTKWKNRNWMGRVATVGILCLSAVQVAADHVKADGVAEPGQSVWIQVGARASGLAGSQWRTDLGLRSVAAAQANVEVRFYPAGGGSMKSQTTQVAPGVQSVLEDVVGQLGGSGNGAMEVVSDRPVIVTSRTYNQIAAGAACTPGGTFGQYYAAYRLEDGLLEGESAWLVHLAESDRFRSNIALTNMGASPATVQVALFDGAGGLLTTFDVTVPPARFRQETQVFKNRADQTAMQRGSARVTVTAGSGIIASASVIDNITNDPTTIPALRAPAAGPPAGEEITVLLPQDVPLVMVRIPAGTFMMGSPDTERGREDNEGPQHQVTLTQDYYLGKYPVTRGQWAAVMGHGAPNRPEFPVTNVSWNDVCGGSTGSSCTAGSFMGRLNAYLVATGQPGAGTFRVPTEAEWERGTRGGTTTRFSHGDVLACGDGIEACAVHDQFMWWGGNNVPSDWHTQPVGQKLPNPYGLYDVHGMLWEWVADWYGTYTASPKVDPMGPSTGSERVRRGGFYNSEARFCRSATRDSDAPGWLTSILGFRVARSL